MYIYYSMDKQLILFYLSQSDMDPSKWIIEKYVIQWMVMEWIVLVSQSLCGDTVGHRLARVGPETRMAAKLECGLSSPYFRTVYPYYHSYYIHGISNFSTVYLSIYFLNLNSFQASSHQ